MSIFTSKKEDRLPDFIANKTVGPYHPGLRLTTDQRAERDKMATDGFIWCNKCLVFYPSGHFWPNRGKRSNYGYRPRCIKCDKEKVDKVGKRKYFKKKNSGLKRKWVELAGSCCQRCGYNESLAALDFHHVHPFQKKHNPTAIIYNGDCKETRKELDKCCLLCANCHRTFRVGEWQARFIKRENGIGYTIKK